MGSTSVMPSAYSTIDPAALPRAAVRIPRARACRQRSATILMYSMYPVARIVRNSCCRRATRSERDFQPSP